jgi:hypothetical protein
VSEPAWIPISPATPTPQVPPLVDGKWLATKGGAMLWDSPAIADVTGLQAALDAKAKTVSYGTTPPGSPVDGDEWVMPFTDQTGAIMWRFRYRAGSSSAYKWEFIGGPPAISANKTPVAQTAINTWQALSGSPQLTLPRAGEYLFVATASVYNSGAGGGICYIGIYKTGGSGPLADMGATAVAASEANISLGPYPTGVLNATDTVVQYYFTNVAITWGQRSRSLGVWPVRVI